MEIKKAFAFFSLTYLVEEKQQRRRKQSVSDMGTTYILLSLSLSLSSSTTLENFPPILIQESWVLVVQTNMFLTSLHPIFF